MRWLKEVLQVMARRALGKPTRTFDTPYDDGADAALRGRTKNPHPAKTAEYIQWEKGYAEMKDIQAW
ncbi:MAG TPA: hypothetical protein VHM90_07050 [Phycisphaerae bacterium]|nr:hypothetical protein [Phycisphaerae bacterium]